MFDLSKKSFQSRQHQKRTFFWKLPKQLVKNKKLCKKREYFFYSLFLLTKINNCFYNWLYINALNLNNDLADQVIEYDAFTDIVFNPQKSINCQAEAAAIYVSLRKQGLLTEALKDKDSFRRILYSNSDSNWDYDQVTLFWHQSLQLYENSTLMYS